MPTELFYYKPVLFLSEAILRNSKDVFFSKLYQAYIIDQYSVIDDF